MRAVSCAVSDTAARPPPLWRLVSPPDFDFREVPVLQLPVSPRAPNGNAVGFLARWEVGAAPLWDAGAGAPPESLLARGDLGRAAAPPTGGLSPIFVQEMLCFPRDCLEKFMNTGWFLSNHMNE